MLPLGESQDLSGIERQVWQRAKQKAAAVAAFVGMTTRHGNLQLSHWPLQLATNDGGLFCQPGKKSCVS
jgi:hypothetical protein